MTYLHKYARTLSAIENESSKAKHEIWPPTRHKEQAIDGSDENSQTVSLLEIFQGVSSLMDTTA